MNEQLKHAVLLFVLGLTTAAVIESDNEDLQTAEAAQFGGLLGGLASGLTHALSGYGGQQGYGGFGQPGYGGYGQQGYGGYGGFGGGLNGYYAYGRR